MANPQVYSPSGTSINQSIVAALLDKKAVEPFVIEQFPKYHVIDTIVSQLGSSAVETVGKRKYEIPKLGNTYPASTIATRTLNGGVLTLTWQDPTATPFRVEELIVSETEVGALCIESIPGQAKFIFQYAPDETQTGFTGSDFLALEEVSTRGSMPAVSSGKVGTTRRVTQPVLEHNYVGLFQDTASFNYEEASEKTYLKDGYWIESAIYQAMQNATETYAVNRYSSIRSYTNDRYTHDGFEQQVNRGGGVIKNYSGEISETYIQNMIDELKANGAGGSRYLVVAGYDYKGGFQRGVAKGYITYVGKNNTIGGETVKGIDADTYSYNGVTIDLVEEPMFSNPNMFIGASAASTAIKQARKAFWFCQDKVTLANGMGTVPFMKTYKYGEMDMAILDYPGAIDKNGKLNLSGMKARSLEYTCDILINKTVQLMNPAACGVHIGN